MKDQMLKIAKVKSEKEFYKKYPSEEAFMKAHGKAFKKAAMGSKMVNDQLHQLTDFGNPPIAQYGAAVNPNTGMFQMPMSGKSVSQFDTMAAGYGSTPPPEGFGNVASTASAAGGFDAGAAGMAGLQGIGKVIGGIEAITAQRKAQKKAQQSSELGELALTAQQTMEKPKNQYVRPENDKVQPGQLGNPYGNKTNYLQAQNGTMIGGNPTEIQNMYNPGDMYNDLGFEPLEETYKQYQKGGKVKFDPSTYKSRPEAESSDIRSSSNLLLSAGDRGANSNDFSNYSTTINKYANMGNDTSYMSTRNTPTGTEEFFHNTNQGNPISQLRRGKEFINLSPEQVNSYKQKVLTGTGGFKQGGEMPKAEFGEYFQDSGEAQIGSAVGGAVAQGFGLPPQLGELVGKVAGNLAGGAKNARKLQAQKDKTAMNQSMMGFEQARSQGPLNANVKNGGWISHDWQPQVFAKFGEYDAKDLLKPPHDADMLRSGGHIAQVGYTAPSAEALYTGRPDMPQAQFGLAMGTINKGMIDTIQNSEKANKLKQAISAGMMEQGGQMALGGELQIGDGGYAETLSYNPNLPGGEIGMFRGASHDNGGIQTQYGENGVEVEGGEPFTVLEDNGSEDGNNLEGGGSKENLVVFGNIKINKEIADLIGDPKAKGKKFKTYIADVAKNDAKQLKTIQKGLDLIEEYNGNSSYDKLGMNSGMANLMGAKAQQKINADKIKEAGIVQDSIHKVANEYGVKSDKLAEGKFEKETDPSMIGKNGKKMKKAQTGGEIDPIVFEQIKRGIPVSAGLPGSTEAGTGPEVVVSSSKKPKIDLNLLEWPDLPGPFTKEEAEANTKDKKQRKPINWKALGDIGKTALSYAEPFLRPSNANEDLPPDQLYPEYFALATNQLEPVQAQQFQPMLDTPYDISFNDQINAIDSQSRAALRAAGSNPAAQAMIMAQTIEAKNKLFGESNRVNQANKMAVYDKNRAMLNDAKLKNLAINDQQYVRQSEGKSKTKAQNQAIVSSIAAKVAQQRATNRKLAIMENMYGFRFSPSGRAINMNAPAQFNTLGSMAGTSQRGLAPGYGYTYDDQQQIIGTRRIPKSDQPSMDELDGLGKNGKKVKARNSSIVKALKNL
jgi:hypothetical protein